jgi:hypothetical protein
MSFELFDFDRNIKIMGNNGMSNQQRIEYMKQYLPMNKFPDHIVQYILSDASSEDDICFHLPSNFGGKSDYTPEEIANIRRTKGIFSTNEFSRGERPTARHHLKIYCNSQGKARLFYKVNGASIRFIQNKK